jgi:hypothetical protein
MKKFLGLPIRFFLTACSPTDRQPGFYPLPNVKD